MSNILVFLQHKEGKIQKSSLTAISGAAALKDKWSKGDLIGICLGTGAENASKDATEYGLSKVYFSEANHLENYTASNYSVAVLEVVSKENCDTVVGAATSTGKDLMPLIAFGMDAGQASDIISVNDDGTVKRPMYAGDVLADVEILTEKKALTIRTTAFDPAQKSGQKSGKKLGSGESIKLEAPPSDLPVKFISFDGSGGDRPELGDAEIVVSGGRAMKSEESFMSTLGPLADALNAALGASRAAVDAGYAPNDWQVGQTGKIVAPNLYIACGISGAIQHIAGMKDSKTIVAINKDPDAPIFEVADYGLVADLYQAVPEFLEELKK